ncbi:MAG: S41 family peptidase [Gemmatimonadaceae bacterium]
MKTVALETLMLMLVTAVSAAAQTERYAGTARLGGDPPLPVHAELQRDGAAVTGVFTIPGGVFKVEGLAVGEQITGRFTGDGAAGEFTLRLRSGAAEGEFTLGDARGTIAMRRTTATAQEALGPPPQKLDLTAEQWRVDLDELIRILTLEHGSPFHRVSREAFEAEAARVRAQLSSLTGAAVATAFRRLSMLIGDGHTGVSLLRGSPRYPVLTFWFADGLRVVQTTREHRHLLGARLKAVDGVPFRTIAARLRSYSPLGETDWSWRADLPYLINRPELLQSVGLALKGPSVWTFEAANGRTERVTLIPAELPAVGQEHLGGQPPLWARQPEEQFWSEFWPGTRTLYVNFRGYDELARNSAALAAELDAKRPRRLIIDMRDNGGGDYTRGRELLLPVITQRPWINRRDAVFVLVGRHTFSAAMANAADFKSRTNATLVGEPIGEKPNSWQEPRRFYLPNSGLPVNVSTRWYAFAANGENAIEPHVKAEPRWQDWARGRDNAIAAILR